MQRFPATKGGLDEEQTDAILELKLYRLARLEINLIQEELKAKQKRAREIQRLLKESTDDTNNSGRWKIVREEIESLVGTYAKTKKVIVVRKSLPLPKSPNTAKKISSLPKTAISCSRKTVG